jgi:hypothetical protein
VGCATCHGADYRGGWSEVSCYGCHDGPGGHPIGWRGRNQHGDYAETYGIHPCAACHGQDYRGDWTGVSCYQCHDGPLP